MDVNSGLVITQEHITEITITDLVIKSVEKMGYEQGFPITGLKFTNRQGQIYYDNDWITGVVYDEYEYEQQENEIDDDNEEIDSEEQQQELAEVLHAPPESNPTINDGEEDEENNDEQQVEEEFDNEDEEEQSETEQPAEPAT